METQNRCNTTTGVFIYLCIGGTGSCHDGPCYHDSHQTIDGVCEEP
jgi:hypothetical protein